MTNEMQVTEQELEEEKLNMNEEINKEEEKAPSDDDIKKAQEIFKAIKRSQTMKMFHNPTSAHSSKKRGVGVTRKNKEQSKKNRKTSKLSRKINRK